ncbi:MAG: L,D-transpeptidase family protein [Clostridia bacterium]|nr:L,D-transpeptidase family protein [Clostridia bacterium]
MNRRQAFLLIFLFFLLPCMAMAEELAFTVAPDVIYPGKVERVSFYSPLTGKGVLILKDSDGQAAVTIRDSIAVSEGENHLTWDGMDTDGEPIAAGDYSLSISISEREVSRPVRIGQPSPRILNIAADDSAECGGDWAFAVTANEEGTLSLRVRDESGAWQEAMAAPVQAGETELQWNCSVGGAFLGSGVYTLQFVLTNGEGFSSTARQMQLTLIYTAASAQKMPARTILPTANTPKENENNYWTYPIGDLNEAALWEIMMQPMTVIDGNQTLVYRLRKTPDDSQKKDNVVGEITYASQGVHVLETLDNGWTLVEAYNSSYGPDCASRRGYGVTDDLIQGYVKTSLLRTVTPKTDYALLIDKLNQTLYIFSEGKCIGTLLVSTGLNNATQSWNETPSGEYVMISKMGGFPAGNLWCAYGMRINGGCAIHEVPYIGNNDTEPSRRDYSSTLKFLGRKASHGCIRVQKAANENGQNIKWLWDHITKNTKVLIWDDTGRIRPYPVADDYELYYNPVGGKYYHENQYCPGVRDRYLPLTPFTYGELEEGDFAKLTPCSKCTTLLRKSQIDAMNQLENPDLYQ